MRVACPECSAEYNLPPALAGRLDGTRSVRCARCGTAWTPRPEGQPPAPPPPEPPAAEPAPDQVQEQAPPPAPPPRAMVPVPPPKPRRLPAALAWVASLLLLAGLAAAAWHWRIALVEAWPPAARIFLALDLAG